MCFLCQLEAQQLRYDSLRAQALFAPTFLSVLFCLPFLLCEVGAFGSGVKKADTFWAMFCDSCAHERIVWRQQISLTPSRNPDADSDGSAARYPMPVLLAAVSSMSDGPLRLGRRRCGGKPSQLEITKKCTWMPKAYPSANRR